MPVSMDFPRLNKKNDELWVTNAQGKFIFDFATIGLGA